MKTERLPPEMGRDSPVKRLALRFGVALVWSAVIGSLMFGGAVLFGLPNDEQVSIGILGGVGAAVCVILFAGRI